MCTKCGCQDREICELCGGESNRVTENKATNADLEYIDCL